MGKLMDEINVRVALRFGMFNMEEPTSESLGRQFDLALVESTGFFLELLENGTIEFTTWERDIREAAEWMDNNPSLKAYEAALQRRSGVPSAGRTFLKLARRRAQHITNIGSLDSRRGPDPKEARDFAGAMLDGIRNRVWWERDPVTDGEFTEFVADRWLSTRDPVLLQFIFQGSEEHPVYWDALRLICAKLSDSGEFAKGRAEPHYQLLLWHLESERGARNRPEADPAPHHRRPKTGYVFRDNGIRITIRLLELVGMPPLGDRETGCSIVAEVMDMEERTVRGIWGKPAMPIDEFHEMHIKRFMPESFHLRLGPGSSAAAPPF